MFGKILYISDNIALIENKVDTNFAGDLLNLHLIFENGDSRILGEITQIKNSEIEVKLLGEFNNQGKYANGLLRKASLNSKIRTINIQELTELIGNDSKNNLVLGTSTIYKNYKIYPEINGMFANHMCILGNSGSGKSCGVARIVQNILENKNTVSANANLIFFDSFGEYKNAFENISGINNAFKYKFITSNVNDVNDVKIQIPVNLLTIDDYAILLQADKHSQLTILERTLKFARIFSQNNEKSKKVKNAIIANSIMTIMYSNSTSQQKKDDIFSIVNICSTPEFNINTPIQGIGYTRSFSDCFVIDSKGKFAEEVLITEYVLKFANENVELNDVPNAIFDLKDFAKALDFTLISEGFTLNKNMHDDAQLLKVRLNTVLNNEIGDFFVVDSYDSLDEFIGNLLFLDGKKCQIVNINLENLDDIYAKALVKIYSHILFEFSKRNVKRASTPFHLFLEEAHRYIQKDNDVFLLGYNIFDRIAKEGRKYGVILDIISQRPVEISDTVIAQCSNFLIFKMTHPIDIKYIEEMLPNISGDVIEKMKVLQPGTCVAFGSAFKIPMICKLEMPNPRPYSASCDVSSFWSSPIINQQFFKDTNNNNNNDNNKDKTNIININNDKSDNSVVNGETIKNLSFLDIDVASQMEEN